MPNDSSLRRPSSVSQSLVQGGNNTSSTMPSVWPSSSRAVWMDWRMTSVAGQPE
jgi:hypothetical protein